MPNLSILHLVLNASWVVQLVMLLLVAVSVASWAAIFRKLFGLKRVKLAQRRPSSASSGRAPA
jgi:biopolymer transport protein TolQ